MRAAEPGKLVAVLEFKDRLGEGQNAAQIGYFSDRVRTALLKQAPELRVITRENLQVLLDASGKSLADCEGECEVDTGRRIGADLVVSGELLRVGSTLKLNLRLHETKSGTLVSGAVASGKALDELDGGVTAAVTELLAPMTKGAKASDTSGQKASDTSGSLSAKAPETTGEKKSSDTSSSPPPPRLREAQPKKAPAPSNAISAEPTPHPSDAGRVLGFWALGVGGAAALTSGFFILKSKSDIDSVQNGGLANPNEIQDLSDKSVSANKLAWGFGIGAAALVGTGIGLILTHPAIEGPVALAPTSNGVTIAGRF
ncbi:MAG: DUF2380 domain-containing protein [Deltaproteobacteria bacterium]|nr:DUF2380 domain-containing protein [Deltaproteobacteria bacterium]